MVQGCGTIFSKKYAHAVALYRKSTRALTFGILDKGVTLNHAKEAALHFDINPLQTVFWFTTTGWMMWQWLIGGALTRGAAALLYDGDPFHPRPSHLWEIAMEAEVDVFGTSAKWLHACSTHEVCMCV